MRRLIFPVEAAYVFAGAEQLYENHHPATQTKPELSATDAGGSERRPASGIGTREERAVRPRYLK